METQVFLEEALDRPLALAGLLESEAGAYDPTSVFWLPEIARQHLASWIEAAFAHWRRDSPETFPLTADWHSAAEWLSPQEVEASDALAAFEVAEEERVRLASTHRQRLLQARENAAEEGARWRALLLETGDSLVMIVLEALEELGFQVTQSDELPEHRGKKREDLRVRDGDWIALVEVKGYGKAAKSNDLLQLAAAGATFAAAKHRLADALWYVPNTYREIAPAQREQSLIGRDDDVLAFAEEHHGCVIETPQLFRLRQRVALDQLPAVEARELLKRSVGRLELDLSASPPGLPMTS